MIYFIHHLQDKNLQVLRGGVSEPVIVADPQGSELQDLQQAEIVVAPRAKVSNDFIDNCKNIRWLHIISAGNETVPFEVLKSRDILLTNSRGIHGAPMAEQILGMILSFTRGLHFNLYNQEHAHWEREYPLSELTNQTLCIVGAGTIGNALAIRAKAFGMRVIGIKSNAHPLPNHDLVVSPNEIHGILPKSDFIVVLTPLTPDTFHLIGESEFAEMKRSAIFLNFSRGDVIDEDALIMALQQGLIRGAGLDVFHKEPLPENSPLWGMRNVIISPHNGGGTPNHDDRLIEIFLKNYRAFKSNHPMPTEVNLDVKY